MPISVTDASRGSARGSLEPVVNNGRLVWMPAPDGDEHVVEVFDAAGLPVGAPAQAASPFAMPASTPEGWIRVEARRQGQRVARSALVRFTRSQ